MRCTSELNPRFNDVTHFEITPHLFIAYISFPNVFSGWQRIFGMLVISVTNVYFLNLISYACFIWHDLWNICVSKINTLLR